MITSQADLPSVLIRRKVLTAEQLRGARQLQRQTNGRLRDVLVEFGYLTREQLGPVLTELDDGRPVIDLTGITISRSIIKLVPEFLAREKLVIPIALVDSVLHLAMGDPEDVETLAMLEFILNRKIRPVAAPREQIIACIDRHYAGLETESVDFLPRVFTETTIDLEEVAGAVVEDKAADDDLESSKFNLALEESGSRAADTMEVPAHQTQLAMDDAAREAMDAGAFELSEQLAAPAAAPVVAETRSGVPAAAGMRFCLGEPIARSKTAGGQPVVERQATIRYYHRMSPERMFPLLVVISRKAILEVVKRHVVQKQSQKFKVELGSEVEVEPILPGCDCFPPRETVKIGKAESTARFWVVPRVLGEVMHARVVVRQNGVVLAEVPLEMCVVKQTLTLFVGALNFCVPFVSMLLKQSQLSLAGDGGTGLVAALAGWMLLVLSPEVLAGVLLAATVGLYFWLRPRQRDVFWDIQPSAGAPRSPSGRGNPDYSPQRHRED